MWKRFITGYLSFTKKDRTGIFVLLILIGFFIILPFCYPYFVKDKTYDHQAFEKAIASLQLKQADSSEKFENGNPDGQHYKNYYPTSRKNYSGAPINGELFDFDPNSASISDWKRLGVRDKTIATIQNYLAKGGKFYKKEDIKKIWGLHEDEVARLTPYIQIAGHAVNPPAAEKYEKKEYKKPVYTINIVDINNADTAAFIALPGIGSKLSVRIINFRDKLGGFYKVEQIGETFGLPDSTFQKIKPYLKISPGGLKLININTATVDDIKSHPYFRYAIANAIIQYRTQHGSFAAVGDLKKIMVVTEEVFNKLQPYATVNN